MTMSLKRGYDYDDYPVMSLEVVKDGYAEASIEIGGVKVEEGGGSPDYGATVILEDKKIVGFRIKAYDIELRIPASIEAHNAIQKALRDVPK
jgi:hypothetical protein